VGVGRCSHVCGSLRARASMSRARYFGESPTPACTSKPLSARRSSSAPMKAASCMLDISRLSEAHKIAAVMAGFMR
jgi:hypothetical protein